MPGVPRTEAQLHEELSRLRQRVKDLEKDQSACRKTLEELEKEREFSRIVVDSLKDAIYVVSADDCTICYSNQVFLDVNGLEPDQVIGRPCYEVLCGRERVCESLDKGCASFEALGKGQPVVSDHSCLDQEGRKAYIECTMLPVLDKSGRLARVVHTERDVSKRRRTEEQLQEANRDLRRSNAFLRNLIMSSVDAVIAADMQGKILIFNRAAGQISGYSEEEALSELDIRDVYPGEGAREVMRKLRSRDYGGKGKLKSEEVEILRKDGDTVPISLSASIVYEDGQEEGTVGFFYDLREKRRMERELDKTRIQLLQAEKMASVGKLAAGVAHQLNNPLGGITLYAKLLLEEYEIEAGAKEDVERILDDAERCRVIVRELLQFARQTTKETRPFDINEALTRTLFLLQNQSLFQNIEIVTDLDPSLPKVPSDIQQLSQAFMNIILNAADAMQGKGRIQVRTGLNPARDGLVVEIADTGPGIPEEVLAHVFEPFFTTKEEGQGTGLGLSVVYGIIENHHGRIAARNRPEGGAAFVIELPLAPRSDRGLIGD